MDILSLGANAGVIVGIIAFTQLIKQFLNKKKFEKYYILIPTGLSIIGAFVTTSANDWKLFISNIFLYVGVSTYLYKSGKTFIFGDKK